MYSVCGMGWDGISLKCLEKNIYVGYRRNVSKLQKVLVIWIQKHFVNSGLIFGSYRAIAEI